MASVSSVSFSPAAFRTASFYPSSACCSRVGVNVKVSSLNQSSSRSIVAFAHRRKTDSVFTSSGRKKKNVLKDGYKEEEDVDGDAFEALFAQLEEDLKNDSSIEDEDGELTEDELAKLESELEEAMMEDDDLFKMLSAAASVGENENDDGEEEEEDEDDEEEDEDEDEEGEEDEEEDGDEEKSMKLKNWQLRRLARALKVGRRKTSIKSLAAELCLDRALVLDMLRDPPPKLLMMSAMLSDEPVRPAYLEPVVKLPVDIVETVPEEKVVETVTDKKVPIHAMQNQWSTQKRLKKVQVQTLERVYRRTKRPTNTMINSIVHVTNLPRKKVVKWFEDKRDEDGVPNERLPYARSTPETVFSS